LNDDNLLLAFDRSIFLSVSSYGKRAVSIDLTACVDPVIFIVKLNVAKLRKCTIRKANCANVDLTRLLLKLIEFNPALHLAWRLLDTRRTAIVAITDLAKRYSINSICDRFCTAVGENKVTGPRMPAAKSED